MALHEENNQEKSQAQARTAAPQGTESAKYTEPTVNSLGFHGGTLFGAPISRSVGSEVYAKLKAALAEVYKATNENIEISLIDLDNMNETALAFSSIVVAVRFKNAAKQAVAYHILTLAATGDKLSPYFENANNFQIEVIRVPSDAVDEILLTKARERVSRAYPNAMTYFCDATVVPAEFNADDRAAVHRLALNTGLACTTELRVRDPQFVDMNLAEIPLDSSLYVNMGFKREQILDAVGQPVRSDIQVAFSSKRNQSGQGRNVSVNSGDREVKVYEASAFVDMVWAPANTQSPMYQNWGRPTNEPKHKYAARLVITDLRSELSYTPASVLLALLAATSVRDESTWIQVFRPMPDNGLDLTDVGALNIEANLEEDPSGIGQRVDTKSENFKLQDLGKYMATLVHPGLIVSLDCPEYGPQAWFTSVHIGAARGSKQAYDVLFEAAMSLTNGNFGKHFNQNQPIFADEGARIHLGTWVDRQGNKRDLREIDHVAMCNLVGERNPQIIREFSDTFLNMAEPLNKRLAARKRIYSAVTNETAVITGFAQRLTFTREFIEALNMGVRETGLQVRVTSPLTGADFNNQRAVAGFAASALMAPGQTFQQAGYGAYQNPNGFYGGGGFRYQG